MKVRPSGIYTDKRYPYVTLDSFGAPVEYIDIDMFGSEIDVLKGAKETLIKYKPELLITLYDWRVMKERERIIGLLTNIFGLRIDVKDEGGGNERAHKLHIWIKDWAKGETSTYWFRDHELHYHSRGPEPIFYFTGWTKEVRFRDRYIRKGEVVYDLGAHIGGWTLPMALENTVYAFEPDKDAVKILEDNIRLNNLNTVQVFNVAIGNNQKPNMNNCYSSNMVTQWITLDDFVTRGPPPDFIKIDVEGDELEVLQGAQETISRYKPRIFIETHIIDAEPMPDGTIKGGFNTYQDTLDYLLSLAPYKTEVEEGGNIYAFINGKP